MQFKRKVGPIFAGLVQFLAPNCFSSVWLLLDVRLCRKLSSYAISRKTYNPNPRNWQKTSLWACFGSAGYKFGPPIFFSKIWLCPSVDIMVSYCNVQYHKKPIILSWENLVTDWRTDRQTDRQTDESNLIGRCPTNVERPTTIVAKLHV